MVNSKNIATLRPGDLVRIRGFVQDMFDAEYYQSGEDCNLSLFQTPSLTERTPIFITPIPFSTEWYRKSHLFQESEETMHRECKRPRCCSNQPLQQTSTEDYSEQLSSRNGNAGRWWNRGTMQSDPSCVPVLAKFYYEQYQESKRVRLNEIVEVVGIVDCEMDFKNENEDPGIMEIMEGDFAPDIIYSSWAVPENIPRIHVLSFQSLPAFDDLAAPRVSINPSNNHRNPKSYPRACFAQLMSMPESSPVLTALYLALLSQAEREQKHAGNTAFGAPSVTPLGSSLGCASINLVLPDVATCHRLKEALEDSLVQVVPVLQSLTVNRETLGTILCLPAKRNGRILPHALQLPQGATLILDLSLMTEGSLSEEQASTLQGIQALTQSHNLDYQFEGNMRLSFEADWRIIVLSTPVVQKLLPCTVTIKCNSGFLPVVHDSSSVLQPQATCLRYHLQRSRSMGNIALSKEILLRAPRDFCMLREQARQNEASVQQSRSHKEIESNDFHRWLTWARLCARDRGATEVEAVDWEAALALDRALVHEGCI